MDCISRLTAVTRALDSLTAALDAYLWLFSRGVLRPAPFIEGNEAFLFSSGAYVCMDMCHTYLCDNDRQETKL